MKTLPLLFGLALSAILLSPVSAICADEAAPAEKLPEITGQLVSDVAGIDVTTLNLSINHLELDIATSCGSLASANLAIQKNGSFQIPALSYSYSKRVRVEGQPQSEFELDCMDSQDDGQICVTVNLMDRDRHGNRRVQGSSHICYDHRSIPGAEAFKAVFGKLHFGNN
ncbi:MAG: hypothetical protein ACXWQO_00295 [Bdellovibrionota bacterium]